MGLSNIIFGLILLVSGESFFGFLWPSSVSLSAWSSPG